MLGLGAALSGPYSGSLGAQNVLHGGGWNLTGVDFEAELTSLKTCIDTTQRSLTQLENKLGGRLEHICRRHVEDALSGSGQLQDVKQCLTRLQHECRHLGLEAGRLPSAQDVDEALERHRNLVEERTTEKISNLERTVTQQSQLAMERLEGRGGETWRVCLQRMSALEERAVLQSDTPRLIEHALNEVRRAGPEIFGAAGTTPSSDVSMLKSALRKLEVKLAGCEARVLGLSEDTSAEGRVWRASTSAKVETLDRLHQDILGRLAGCEAGLKAVEENTRLSLESAQASALEAQKRAENAEALTLDAKNDALKHAEVVLQNALVGLEARTQERSEAHRRDVSSVQKHLQELAFDLVTVKQESSEAGKDRVLSREQLTQFGTEMETLVSRINAMDAAAKERSAQELERGIVAVKQDVKIFMAKKTEPLRASLDQLVVKVSSADGRMNSTASRIDSLEESLARLVARVEAPGKAMEHMISAMSGISTGGVQHTSRQVVSQSIITPSVHETQDETLRARVHRPNQPVFPNRVPESNQPVQAPQNEDEEVLTTISPPVFSFGQGNERPPRMPAEIENSPSVRDPSFGEVSRVDMQTFVSHAPDAPVLSPGELCESASALMSATPSRVPGDAIGEETGIAPADFGLAEEDDRNLIPSSRRTPSPADFYEHNPWDDTDEEDRVAPVAEEVLSPPTLGPVPGESEESNFSVPLPEVSEGIVDGTSAIVTQPQAVTQQPVAPQNASPPRESHSIPPSSSPPFAGPLDVVAKVDDVAEKSIKLEATSFQHDHDVSDWDISGSLEGEVASQVAKRAESLRTQSVGQGEVPQQVAVDPEVSVSDWDASRSLDGNATLLAAVSKAKAAMSQSSPKAKSSPPLAESLEEQVSDWDASGSFDAAAMGSIAKAKAVAKTSSTTPKAVPKAKAEPIITETAEQMGSDWDASGSFDGAAVQSMATAKAKAKAASEAGKGVGKGIREQLDESVSDWDASGSFEGVRAPRSQRVTQTTPSTSTVGAPSAKAAAAPLVGLGGAQRFGVQSSLDILQNSTSSFDEQPRANLEASNSWDMGNAVPTPKATSNAQPFAKAKADPWSAREQQRQVAASLGLDLDSGASENVDDVSDDLSLPGT